MGFIRYLFGKRMGRTPWSRVVLFGLFFAGMLVTAMGVGGMWVPLVFGAMVLGMLVWGAWLNYKTDGDA